MREQDADFVLTRSQVLKLAELANHFTDTQFFNLFENSDSGIGPSVLVRFDLFEQNDTEIDITDVSCW